MLASSADADSGKSEVGPNATGRKAWLITRIGYEYQRRYYPG